MASEFELALFEQEFADILASPDAARWVLERDMAVPLGLYATLRSSKAPEEAYLARLRWTKLFEPPSLKFVTLDTRSAEIPLAWPQCNGFRPASLDACVSWTAEGHQLHPDWRDSTRTAFRPRDRPIHFAIELIQHELDCSYQGRGHA